MPIAAVINGATYAIHSDHLNTPRKLTNANGQAVWQWSYSAFGEDKPTIARNRFANLETTPNPGTTNISEVKFHLRYPGQYADDESGLFYNGYRSYRAIDGRYTQGDPIGLRGGWNRFGYVNANPLKYSDPTGLTPECKWVGTVLECSAAPPVVSPDGIPIEPTGIPWPKLLPQPWVEKIVDMCTNKESAECSKVRGQCSERCADATFPTKDYAVSFRRCLNRCMRDNGCKATDAGEY
jgi:RHS repeat-associated protein